MVELRGKTLGLVGASVFVVTTLCGVVMAMVDHDEHYFMLHGYYVSAFLDFEPVRAFVGFGYSVLLFLLALMMLMRHVALKDRLASLEFQGYLRLLTISTGFGMTALLSMMGVLCFGMTKFKIQHNLFAAMTFICFFTQMVLDTYVFSRTRMLTTMQRVHMVLAMVFMTYFVIVALIVVHLLSTSQTVRLTAFVAEYLAFLHIFFWHATFWTTNNDAKLELHVSFEQESPKQESKPQAISLV